MQKKLIALAIAGLASTAAFAQSNVTLYGIVDASVDFTDSGDTATVSGQRVTKISSNSSRIGFKGTEDLGNGLKAVFQIESSIEADGSGGDTVNGGRDTFVGLAGDSWGQVIVGRRDTPYKTSTRRLDLFGDHHGDNRNLMGRNRTAIAFDQRAANTVRYDSTDFGGLKLAVAYIAGAESATDDGQDKGTAWSLSGVYSLNSEFDLIAAYERHKFGTAATGSYGATAPVVSGEAEKAWKLGASYKSGPFQASAVYEKVSDDFSAAAAAGEHKAWTLAGGYTMGSNLFKLAYTMADDYEGVSDSGAKQWAVGVDHLMSKRTKLYAEYVRLTNDSAATYGLAGGGATSKTAARGAGADPSAWQFGVRHNF